jgi:hypothetical protein
MNVRASVLTNKAASAPGTKRMPKRRTRFSGSFDPQE